MAIRCIYCGEDKERNLEISYNYNLNGLVYCTCKTCKKKFVAQDGEGEMLGKYISARSKFYSSLEVAKLSSDFAKISNNELKEVVSAYSTIAEIDPIYHWYKIVLITDNFSNYDKLKEAEKEYGKIPKGVTYYVAKEDLARIAQYEAQYADYKKEIEGRASKTKKKRILIVKLVLILAAVIACAVGAVCIYSCVRKSKEYTLNLDYGEAYGEVTSLKAYDGEKIEGLPAGLTVQDKYYLEFEGWYTEANCGGIKVADADGVSTAEFGAELKELSKNNTLQLFAGFKVKEYTVTLMDGASVIKTMKARYGTQVQKLTAGITTSGGLTVLSWSDGQGGSVFDGEVTENLTLYALSYGVEILFDSNGGSEISGLSATVGDTLTLPTPTRQYHRFVGWEDESGLIEGAYTVPHKKVTLTAQWERTHFTVTYDTSGGSEAESEIVRKGAAVTLPNPTRNYYRLIGWEYNGQFIGYNFVMPEKDVTLTALWEKTHYAVTFNGTTEYVRIGESVTLPNITKTGYTFNGWLNEGKIYNGTFVPTRDIILTESLEAKTFIITLNANGGNVASSTKNVAYDSLYNLPIPKREGFVFGGWYTSANNLGKKRTDEKGESLSKWKEVSDTTLYAIWTTDYYIDLNRESCDEDYTPADTWIGNLNSHNNWELSQLVVKNVAKNDSNQYYVADGMQTSLGIKLLQDINNLPKINVIESNIFGKHYAKELNISDDNFSGAVYDTNISGKKIGLGAYYIKCTLKNGTVKLFNKTDLFRNAKKGDIIEINLDEISMNQIASVEFVLIYEVRLYVYNGGWYTNYPCWRCSATINFE